DGRGDVIYEVDVEGYVTKYDRDAFGNVLVLTRYAVRTNLQSNGYRALTASQIDAVVNALGVDHSEDRAIYHTYDTLGRVVEVSQSQIYAYDSSAATSAQYFTSRKVTQTQYN